jgi:hypothetical protein
MKRFIVAAALAVAIGFGTAATADAQYVIQYNRVTPNGGVATTNQVYNLGTYQTYNTYVSPFGNVRQSAYYADVFGNRAGAANGFNNWTGYGYNRGFYNPGPFMNPYGGYNYNFYGPRW